MKNRRKRGQKRAATEAELRQSHGNPGSCGWEEMEGRRDEQAVHSSGLFLYGISIPE